MNKSNLNLDKKIVNRAVEFLKKKDIENLEKTVDELFKNNNQSSITFLFSAALSALKFDFIESSKNFEEAIKISPNFSEAHRQYAELLRVNNKIEKALFHAKKAIELSPQNAAIYDTLGNVLIANGEINEAIEIYEKGLKIFPDLTTTINNLGNAYRRVGRIEESILCFERCIKNNPDQAVYFTNMALSYFDLGNYKQALESVKKANNLVQNNAHVYVVTGHILTKLYKFSDAEKSYKHAIKLNPKYSSAYNGLANVQKLLGKLDECLENIKTVLKYSTLIKEDYSNLLLVENYLFENDYEKSYISAKKYQDLFPNNKEIPKFTNNKNKKRKLKIGFVSADFYEHPVGYFLDNFLSNLRKDSFEIFAYYNHKQFDLQTNLLEKQFDHFAVIKNFSDNEVFNKIRSDKIDILFDLSGHTALNRLGVFQMKAAPIQISWLGYCYTTGLENIDYILCDNIVLPKKHEKWFVEKPIRMSNSYYCFSLPREHPILIKQKINNNNSFHYGCFSNAPKITNEVISLWSKILKETKNSKIILKAKSYSDRQGYQRIIDIFKDNNIDPSRLLFEGNDERENYLKSYNKVDVILDTFHYPGGTTTCEALYMGVPVITMKGDSFLSNNGATILKNSNFNNFIAYTKQEYADIAISLYNKRESLNKESKEKIRKKFMSSSILDGKLFADEFEKKLYKVWGEWCDK